MMWKQHYDPKADILKIFGKEPETLNEVAQCVIATVNSKKDRKGRTVKLSGFSWDVSHSDSVSCSHYSPIGYPRNWGGMQKGEDGECLPRGYPGFEGRIWIRYAEDFDNFGYDLSGTLSHTGTGGSGSYNGPWATIATAWFKKYGYKRKEANYSEPSLYSWDFRFFDSDWPKIAEMTAAHYDEWRKECFFHKLQGAGEWQLPTRPVLKHRFLWEDSEMKAADTEFIEANPYQVSV